VRAQIPVPLLSALERRAAREALAGACEVGKLEARQAQIEVRLREVRAKGQRALEQSGRLLEAAKIAHDSAEHAHRVRVVRLQRDGLLQVPDRTLVLEQGGVQHAELQMDDRGAGAGGQRVAVRGHGLALLARALEGLGLGEPGFGGFRLGLLFFREERLEQRLQHGPLPSTLR
jgi:hypothetical protein